MVAIRGRLRRVADHYFVLETGAEDADARSRSLAVGPGESIRIYPRDAERMADGVVTVRGRLYSGRQLDVPTDSVAHLMMADASLA
ncbi:MAG: hypothetical protein KF842_05780 [Caulobacter sp.]|nr:hypothetical protein [Caulobacter sp.]